MVSTLGSVPDSAELTGAVASGRGIYRALQVVAQTMADDGLIDAVGAVADEEADDDGQQAAGPQPGYAKAALGGSCDRIALEGVEAYAEGGDQPNVKSPIRPKRLSRKTAVSSPFCFTETAILLWRVGT